MSTASSQAIPFPTIIINACDSKANNTCNTPQNVSPWEEDLYPVLPFRYAAPESQKLRVDRQSCQPKAFYSSEPEHPIGESESESEWECVTSFSPMVPRRRETPSRVMLVDLGYLSPGSQAAAEAAKVAVTTAGQRARKPKASPTSSQGSRSNRTTGRAGRTSLPARASMSAAAAAVVQARSQTARSLTARSQTTARSLMDPSHPQRRVSACAAAALTQRSRSDSRLQPECVSSTSSPSSGAYRRGEALALDARRSPRHRQAGTDNCQCSNSAPESPLSRAAQLCAQYLNSLEECR